MHIDILGLLFYNNFCNFFMKYMLFKPSVNQVGSDISQHDKFL